MKAKGYLEGAENFDAEFFQYSAREAKILDPQIRLVQECSWEALEGAGYDPRQFDGLIGLYVGAATNLNWMQLSPLLNSSNQAEFTEAGTLSYKDAISTLTSYKLGLKGPSMTLYTACSTSLLAVHQASRALLTGECQMALAGGVAVSYPQKHGYLYEEGMTSSPDGTLRAFDADAKGAVSSDGAGMVLLKRLDDAIADGDTIHGVILGSAANNDGARKVGYTAPSVEGQTEVIVAAHNAAEVTCESISYIEAHGTATALGDTIEFEALRRAFAGTTRKAFCGIGSVKSNIGHLDTAAGIASLIKALLIIKHRQIPPALHFECPNPKLQLIDSPFYVNNELTTLAQEPLPLRVGVSAFGYGGTNVHVVIEEPPVVVSMPSSQSYHVLTLSARSEKALQQSITQLGVYMQEQQEVNLADVAYTLQVGRHDFPFRWATVCGNLHEAIRCCKDADLSATRAIHQERTTRLHFRDYTRRFTSAAMREGIKLYQCHHDIQTAFDKCLYSMQSVAPYSRDAFMLQFKRLEMQSLSEEIDVRFALQFLWSLDNALYQCLKQWGVQITGVAGEGNAMFMAALVAGAISLEDAFTFTASIHQNVEHDHLEKQSQLTSQLAFYSNAQKCWLPPNSVIDLNVCYKSPDDQSQSWEQYPDLINDEQWQLISVGIEGAFAAPYGKSSEYGTRSDAAVFQLLSELWVHGAGFAKSDLRALYREEKRRRLPLPTYPFEKKRFWLESKKSQEAFSPSHQSELLEKQPVIANWFYTPAWEPSSPDYNASVPSTPLVWLVFTDKQAPISNLALRLKAAGQDVIFVYASTDRFSRISDNEFMLNEQQFDDYVALWQSLREMDRLPQKILHMWYADKDHNETSESYTKFFSLLHLVRAMSKQKIFHEIELTVFSTGMQNIVGREHIYPEKAMLLAPVKIVPQEHPNIRCRSIDLPTSFEEAIEDVIYERILQEIQHEITETVVAYSESERFIRVYPALSQNAFKTALSQAPEQAVPELRHHGVYLITGGLGGVGLKLASYLARAVQANLILTSRHPFPERAHWQDWLAEHDEDDAINLKINELQRFEAAGAHVVVMQADVANEDQMRQTIERIEKTQGALHGVIHAAGILRVRSAQSPIAQITEEDCKEQFRAKVDGLHILDGILEERILDFRILVSSLSPILGGLGFVAYAAGNLFMDAFADFSQLRNRACWLSVNWGDWQYTGKPFQKLFIGESLERLEMTPQEGIRTFQCVLALHNLPHIIISSGDLQVRLDQWVRLQPQIQAASETVPVPKEHTSSSTTLLTLRSQMEMERFITQIWQAFFQVSTVDAEKNFFELGATSLDIIQIHSRLLKQLGYYVPIDVLFTRPTIRQLAYYLHEQQEPTEPVQSPAVNVPRHPIKSGQPHTHDIAVIGLAGRFPGAIDIQQFWSNLVNGVEAISFFSADELREAGLTSVEINNPQYIRAKGYLQDADCFDAAFFEYPLQDAALMDPQLRLYHECSWAALENAGYNVDNIPGKVGVFAGASPNLYWQVLSTLSEMSEPASQFQVSLLNDKDSLSTQISYKFNFKGPSINYFTGCSTSIVTINAASESLLNGHCDLAMAGGITITQPDKAGYLYQEGMLFSADGHCRSFDEQASGMLFGDGVGIVVLKRLEEALSDGDTIHAVIRGSAVNNDGNRKVGYTAPGVDGQRDVIMSAMQIANVTPDMISYIETHGTATKLGDTIEMRALKEVFTESDLQSIPIGSVKASVGHLNAAAGVTGFIKTVLSLEKEQIPPSLNFSTPNKQIDFEHSPFFVNTSLREWKRTQQPRRAGVSSFGIGGTNAHLIVEEAQLPQQTSYGRPWKLFVLSAKTEAALERMTYNLATHLPTLNADQLDDAAYTLQVGRKAFKWRRAFVCDLVAQASELLAQIHEVDTRNIYTKRASLASPPIVFMFSGNGSQYVNMGLNLYQQEPLFRKNLDTCLSLLHSYTQVDFKAILYPAPQQFEQAQKKLATMEYCQPIIFSFEYALAQLLMSWGIRPAAAIGYSFGEYVAACLAGVFTLDDALTLIVKRSQLMQKLPPGYMLSVPLSEVELMPILTAWNAREEQDGLHTISLAIVNGSSCIVSGSADMIKLFTKEMQRRKYLCIRVNIDSAAHSTELDAILPSFESTLQTVHLHPPILPYISNITGTWAQEEQVTDAQYWVRHLRETVRFADGIEELKRNENTIFLEIGPSSDLSVLIQRFFSQEEAVTRIFNANRQAQSDYPDDYFLLTRIAHLWTLGVEVDWAAYHANTFRRRIPMPTYSFEPTRFKLNGTPLELMQKMRPETPPLSKTSDIIKWFYLPQWRQQALNVNSGKQTESTPTWLIFSDGSGLADSLAKTLLSKLHIVTCVREDDAFAQLNTSEYRLRPECEEDYRALLKKLQADGRLPTHIIHCFGVSRETTIVEAQSVPALARGFYSLFYLAKALGDISIPSIINIKVITTNIQQVTAEEQLIPEKAPVLGPVVVIPQEYPYLNCSSIDITLSVAGSRQWQQFIDQLLAECVRDMDDKYVAYRGNRRFIQVYEPAYVQDTSSHSIALRQGGVYIITGGTGGIGLLLAKHLAQSAHAKLILLGRSDFPEPQYWDEWLSSHSEHDRISRLIRKLQELEQLGSEVLYYQVDVADQERLQAIFTTVEQIFGTISGVIHAAGIIGGKTFDIIRKLDRDDCEMQFRAKIAGVQALEACLQQRQLDFCLLMSSISSVLGGIGFAAYAAANIYSNVFSQLQNRTSQTPWLCVNWSDWKYWEDGERDYSIGSIIAELSMTPEEGIAAFERILAWGETEVIAHSPGDLNERINQWVKLEALRKREEHTKDTPEVFYARPDLMTPYRAPSSQIEHALVEIWQQLFKVDHVGVQDEFFELGGDSLKAITLVSRIHKEFQVEVPITELLQFSNIEKLAEYIKGGEQSRYATIEMAEAKSHYVLSSAQQRLYTLYRLYPESTAYNDTSIMQLDGELDLARLQAALEQVVQRHESFRTAIVLVDDVPMQKIIEHVELTIDYDALAEEDARERIQRSICLFDLSQPPLLRVSLFKIGEHRHIMMIDLHHIVTDGVSYDIFVQDLLAFYAGQTLPLLRLQYKDYAEWQYRQKESAALAQQEAYWLQRFQGNLPLLALPTDFPRPVVQDLVGDSVYFTVDAAMTAQIKKLIVDEEVTLYILLLAVYHILLHKYANQDDIVIGSPIAGRPNVDLENIIGVFVNMLAIRNTCDEQQSFQQFLAQVKEHAFAAFTHQQYPYEELVAKLGLQRSLKHNPLFDVAFVLQNMDTEQIHKYQLDIHAYEYNHQRAQFELLLRAHEDHDTIHLTMEYARSLFRHSTIEKMVERYLKILATVVATPDILLRDIGIAYSFEPLSPFVAEPDLADFKF